jgi:hypothetical protein
VTDALVLVYDVPWPVNLLVCKRQLQQYAAVFSVLLRLRRLQQQLTNQWAAINSRPGGSSSSSSSKPHVGSRRPAASMAGRSSSSSRRVVVSRRQSQQEDDNLTAAAAADTLQLQQLRRWHAMAVHCVSSVLGGMLSDLSGHLWVEFETAVSAQPVSLPAIIAAHDKLLVAAQKVCLLPLQQQQQVVGDGCGTSSSSGRCVPTTAAAAAGSKASEAEAGSVDANSRGSAMHTQLAGTVYRLVAAAWQLQQQVQQLLPHTSNLGTSSSNRIAYSGAYREGSSAGSLAQLLQQDEQVWQGCAVAGATLEGLLLTLKKLLAVSRAGELGHSMAGLAARLGLHL